MPEHSVIIYCNDRTRFLAASIDSVLNQTTAADEIIVCDASGDGQTAAVVHSYGARVQRVTQNRESTACLTETRGIEAAYRRARGRLIFLLEGDDRFKPRKIEQYVAAFDRNPDASLIQSPLEIIDDGGAVVGIKLEPKYHITHHLREIYRRHDVNFFYPTSALAFSRYYVERVLPLDQDRELPLWADARLYLPAPYFGRIITLPDPLTEQRKRGLMVGGERAHAHRIRQTLLHARYFNQFCQRHGLRRISPWRNWRIYRQLLDRILPAAASRFMRQRVQSALTRV